MAPWILRVASGGLFINEGGGQRQKQNHRQIPPSSERRGSLSPGDWGSHRCPAKLCYQCVRAGRECDPPRRVARIHPMDSHLFREGPTFKTVGGGQRNCARITIQFVFQFDSRNSTSLRIPICRGGGLLWVATFFSCPLISPQHSCGTPCAGVTPLSTSCSYRLYFPPTSLLIYMDQIYPL